MCNHSQQRMHVFYFPDDETAKTKGDVIRLVCNAVKAHALTMESDWNVVKLFTSKISATFVRNRKTDGKT